MPPDVQPARRRTRIGLYAPVLLLLVLAVGWSIAWFVMVSRTRAGLDEWMAAEAAAGRRWTCADRSLGGYPFRIEVGCSSLALERPDVRATLGRVLVVSQVYRPRHVIAEAAGPLTLSAGDTRVDAQWRLLQASIVTSPGGFDRISLAVDGPMAKIASPAIGTEDLAARRFEAHGRPDPADAGTLDLALRSDGTVAPVLNVLVGSADPADLALQLVATRVRDLPARPLPAELERWRAAGGRLDLANVSVRKGALRAEGRGTFRIDEQHRPEGKLELAAAGIGDLVSKLLAEFGGIRLGGGLVSSFLGGGPASKTGPDAPLTSLPPLQLQAGRLTIGPFALKLRILPLY